jgi:transcriptional regulator with XRE-family HTH domain
MSPDLILINDAVLKLRWIVSRDGGGLSQHAVARRLGLKHMTVWRWANGRTRPLPVFCEKIVALYNELQADGPKVQLRQAA